MGIANTFGFGAEQIIAAGHSTTGVVTAVKRCWWLKVNQKTMRLYSTDGVTFPYIIVFDYTVAGKTYTGSRYVGWNQQCPVEGQNLTVYYDRVHPDRCAVKL